MSLLNYPVIHLRRSNFEDDGTLCCFNNKVVVVFIYSDNCQYCHEAAPEFQRAANQNLSKDIVYAAINAVGKITGEIETNEIIPKIVNNFVGYPDYALFINGRPTRQHFEFRSKKYILDVSEEARRRLKM